MITMKYGQRFKSKSKIQKKPNEYIYRGYFNGQHYIEAASGIREDDCEVDPEWFDNRRIQLIEE